MQQGRVQLDADWNEWTDSIDRRTRAETVDTFGVYPHPGIAGVAVVSPQTPDAFLVEASGGGLTMGQGRMYVDGLLAENFGDGSGPQSFDPVLAEIHGQSPLAYAQQPFHPDPVSLPGGGPHLAYLEVWQREVTHLQRPDLVEKAVGVDTTTRTQTVWQLRLLQNIDSSISCSSPDADLGAPWLDIISPSTGRLSSRDVGVPADEDPCELPPSGGYRGLENQLYRIEIHHGGIPGAALAPGVATFKWSRDNASVGASVVEVISANKLKLASLGRDSVLRFNTGDWVEIRDDWRELSGESGDPDRRFGEIRKITVDDASQTITFNPALPAGLVPTGTGDDTLENRHLRVTRWDQKGKVRDDSNNVIVDLDAGGSKGLIPVPAPGVWVSLENGVQVQFSRDGNAGRFRCNDFWNVAARTATASVEVLNSAPPQGIHRHYARLALVTFPGDETDCRDPWPPEFGGGCCTVTVNPGDDIQAAIDSLPEIGGCICIKTGLHEISRPLRIANSNIVIHGETAGARIRRRNGVNVLVVQSQDGKQLEDVKVQGIRFETMARPDERDSFPFIMVFANRCTNFLMQDCALSPDRFEFLLGVWMGGIEGGAIEGCEIGPVGMGIWVAEDSTGLAVRDSSLRAEFLDGVDAGSVGIWLEDVYGAAMIEDNRILNFLSGIYINRNSTNELPASFANGSIVRGNRIKRSASAGDPGAGQRLFAIDCAASAGLIRGNILSYASPAYGGIRVTGRNVRIEKNELVSNRVPDADGGSLMPIGIQLGLISEKVTGHGEGGEIRRNRLKGTQDAILAVGASKAKITGNRVDGGETRARTGILAGAGDNIEIRGNEFLRTEFALGLGEGEDCSVADNTVIGGRLGLLATKHEGLSVRGNRISGLSQGGMMIGPVEGATSIVENRIESCGYRGLGAFGAFSLLVMNAAGNVHIESCDIVDTGVSEDESEVMQPAFGIFGLFLMECLVQGNRVTYVKPAIEKRNEKSEDRALLLIGHLEWTVSDNIRLGFPAQVVDNKFVGPGLTHLVEFLQLPVTDLVFRRFERVTFSNNYCWHWNIRAAETGGTVSLRGRRAVVMGNQVKANAPLPSFNFNGMTGIYVGNDTDGGVAGFSDFPTPASDFNR
jgi:nitrous oxidase accessory protein NosD